MSDLPTLIVEGSSTDWLAVPECPYETIRIDGPLPTVWNVGTPYSPGSPHGRPLRAGDRVTLAYLDDLDRWIVEDDLPVDTDPIPFATATVNHVEHQFHGTDHDPIWTHYITVTDVEALT